jgi:hypothetical protein
MPLPVPDVGKTEQILNSSNSAASAATDYAQAALTAVPRIPNPPDWFAPIQSDLTTAQTHAQNWLTNLCPAVTSGIPTGVVNFNNTFQSTSQQILGIQQDIQNAGGSPTSDQRSSVASLFGSLITAMDNQQKTINSVQADIQTYLTDLKTDQNNLGNDLGTVADRFVSGHTWIEQLTATIGENFLNSTPLGPCIAIVSVDMNISIQIGGIGADPTLITLVFAKAILENQLSNSPAAQQAVQAILDTWTTLKVKSEAVISDLNEAQDSQYINIMSELDLETAQTQWQQLSDFASGLISGNGTT